MSLVEKSTTNHFSGEKPLAKSVSFDLDVFRAIPFPSENEVMAGWEGDLCKPRVSIICITYNQISYVEDAIKGFLIQKTDFPFEIILHDDASTDGTTEIILDYSAKYPNLIKPVIQDKNQYSLGRSPISLAFSYSKGTYIALCEGDDFWISSDKLKIQFEMALENHSYSLFSHQAYYLRNDSSILEVQPKIATKKLTVTDLIKHGGGACPTASLFIKRKVFESLPSWIYQAPYQDFFLQVFSASCGEGCLVELTPMSIYRVNVPGGWTNKKKNMRHEIYMKELESLSSLRGMLDMEDDRVFRYAFARSEFNYSLNCLKSEDFKSSRIHIIKSLKYKIYSPFFQFAVLFLSLVRYKI